MYWFALLPPLWKTKDAHVDWMTIGITSRNLFSGLTVVRMGDVKITLCGKDDGGGSSSYKYIDLEWVRENKLPQLLKRQMEKGIFYIKSVEVDFPTTLDGLIIFHIEEISVEATDNAYNPISVLPKERTENVKEEKKKGKRRKRNKLFSKKAEPKDDDDDESKGKAQFNKEIFYKKVWIERLSLTVKKHDSDSKNTLVMNGMTTRMNTETTWTKEGVRKLVIRADTVIDKASMKVEGWAISHLTDLGSVLFQALVTMYFPPNADVIHALKAFLGIEEAELILILDLCIKEVSFACEGTNNHEKVFMGQLAEGRTYTIEIGSFSQNPRTVNTLTIRNTNFTLRDFKFHQELKL